MTDACIVFTTCGSEEAALTIAADLVDRHLAACVNLIPRIRSYYYFDGAAHMDEEVKLLIKTRCALFDKVAKAIAECHTYQVPEIMMLRVDAGSEPFLQWLGQTTEADS